MQKITYLGHSGFAVELDQSILVFDYYEGERPSFDPGKPLYVFASHAHADHFQFSIFEWDETHPNVKFILSDDISKSRNARNFARHGVPEALYEQLIFMPAHQTRNVGGLQVETLESTDEGVAFLVTAEGKTIFHAGDLNDWVWEGEPEAENRAMTARWQAEIARLAGRHIDLAFVVLDPRQEGDFYHGLDYFMRHTHTDLVYPMHFWKDTGVFERLRSLECSAPYREKIAPETGY